MASSETIARRRPASRGDDAFSFGIEEEYFLADTISLRPPTRTPNGLFAQSGGGEIRLNRELLQCQIEIATRPHTIRAAACEELKALREASSHACGVYGLKI